MKRLICAILALALLLGLGACGGEKGGTPSKQESPSSSKTESKGEASTPEAEPESAPESEPESQTEAGGPATLAECRAQLLAYYTYERGGNKKVFVACAVEKLSRGTVNGYGLRTKDKTSGPWTMYGDTENWTIYFTDVGFDEGVPLEDIVMSVSAVYSPGEEDERIFSDWGEPAAPETYPEYGIFPVGEHYALFGTGKVTMWKDETYADLTIPVANLFLNGHERYAEEDLSADMFSLYAADGTPLEDAIGLPVANCGIKTNGEDYCYTIRFEGESAGLDTKGVEKAIQEHAGYYVYHCPDGNDYTVNFSLEKK